MTPITIRGLSKHFSQTIAVDSINLDVAAGALFFLLGPSGCGKTTILRMLAGFTDPTAGFIRFGDRDVTHLPPNKRNTGMVFQSYALWPHMTVRQNVAFGLDVRKIQSEEKTRRVQQALQTVRLESYADRKPNQLSGGQQQRVALARAMVVEPTILLLDEPLSNLDAKLRLQMRSQIRDICKSAGMTAVYVTHDQKEALSMADAVAVLRDGQVVQVGTPRHLYEQPNSRFVADFLGETNFVAAEVVGRDRGMIVLQSPAGKLHSSAFPPGLPHTGNVTCSIRPEAIQLTSLNGASQNVQTPSSPTPRASDGEGFNTFHADRVTVVYLGEMAQYQLRVGELLTLKVFELNPRLTESAHTCLRVRIDPQDVVILKD